MGLLFFEMPIFLISHRKTLAIIRLFRVKLGKFVKVHNPILYQISTVVVQLQQITIIPSSGGLEESALILMQPLVSATDDTHFYVCCNAF